MDLYTSLQEKADKNLNLAEDNYKLHYILQVQLAALVKRNKKIYRAILYCEYSFQPRRSPPQESITSFC